jgi:Prokaryotic homologs of the JAB domain
VSSDGRLNDGSPRIHVRDGALGSAASIARGCHPAETGGLLIGLEMGSEIWVWEMIGVRGNVLLSPFSYEREHELASACMDAYLSWGAPSGELGYVGEWHSHPTVHSASFQDLTELADIAVARERPTGLIVVGADSQITAPFAYVCGGLGVPLPAQVVVFGVRFGETLQDVAAGE